MLVQAVRPGRLQADQQFGGVWREPLQAQAEPLEARAAHSEADRTNDAICRGIEAGRLMASLTNVDADGDSRRRPASVLDVGDMRGCPRPTAKHARSGLTPGAAPHFSIRVGGGGCLPKKG